MKVVADGPAADEDDLISLAQRVYAEHYNDARSSPASRRIDTGIKRSAKMHSEASFIAGRRAALPGQAAVPVAERALDAIDAMPEPASWSDNHAKEAAFQTARAKVRQLEAVREGLVLPHKVTDEMRKDAASAQEAFLKAHHARERQRARAEDLSSPSKRLSDFVGARFFVNASVSAQVAGLAAEEGLGTANTTETAELHKAAFIIVKDPTSSTPRPELWAAVLLGIPLVDPLFLRGGSSGSLLQYTRAVKTERSIFISARFKSSHNPVWQVISKCVTATGSKWRLLPDKAAFVAARIRSKGDAKVAAVVTKRDAAEADLAGRSRVYDGPGFMKFIRHLDVKASRL